MGQAESAVVVRSVPAAIGGLVDPHVTGVDIGVDGRIERLGQHQLHLAAGQRDVDRPRSVERRDRAQVEVNWPNASR